MTIITASHPRPTTPGFRWAVRLAVAEIESNAYNGVRRTEIARLAAVGGFSPAAAYDAACDQLGIDADD